MNPLKMFDRKEEPENLNGEVLIVVDRHDKSFEVDFQGQMIGLEMSGMSFADETQWGRDIAESLTDDGAVDKSQMIDLCVKWFDQLVKKVYGLGFNPAGGTPDNPKPLTDYESMTDADKEYNKVEDWREMIPLDIKTSTMMLNYKHWELKKK